MFIEQETPHRSRKDRRRWCRGKVGVEHLTEIRLSDRGRYSLTKDPAAVICRWRHDYKFLGLGRGYGPDLDSWWYQCGHEDGCSACGKVLKRSIGRRCPDYRERRM